MKLPTVILFCASLVAPFTTSWADEPVRYQVKGVVKSLPGKGRAVNEVLIAHERIPEYRDMTGKVVGMDAMTMPFYLASGVSIEGIQAGDDVMFVVESKTEPVFSEKVVSIEKTR